MITRDAAMPVGSTQHKKFLNHLIYFKQPWLPVFLLLLFSIISANINKTMAQGTSCGSPINLGSITDGVYTVNFNYPDTVKWLSFRSDSSRVSFLAYSAANANGNIKIKTINVFDSLCSIISSNAARAYPGSPARSVIKQAVTPRNKYIIKVSRYYATSVPSDSANHIVYIRFASGQLLSGGACLAGECANMVFDGSFEDNTDVSLTDGFDIEDLNCWHAAHNTPFIFNSSFSDARFDIPYQTIYNSGINLPAEAPDDFFPSANDEYIGVRTNLNSSDIVQGGLDQGLAASTDYFVSYVISPGSGSFDSYHDRIDLDIVDPTAAFGIGNSYTPSYWGTVSGYTTTPAVESGIIDFTNTWTRVSDIFSSGAGAQYDVYIGNLALQNYSNQGSIGTDPAFAYYIDNVIIKPFELELGDDLEVCEGEEFNIVVPCQFLFPGATYEWNSDEPGWIPVTTPNLTWTATGNYYYKLTITVTDPQSNTYSINDGINVTLLTPPVITLTVTGGPAGYYCNNHGTYILVEGNQLNLSASGAGGSGVYNWYVGGVLFASNTSTAATPITLTPGSYVIYVTGYDGTCTGVAPLNLQVVTDRCQLPCFVVLGEALATNSIDYTTGSHGFVTSSTSGFTSLPTSNATYVIDGTFTFNSSVTTTYHDCLFLMAPGARVVIEDTDELFLYDSEFEGCIHMWDRIENHGHISARNTTFNHAEAAIEVFEGSDTRVLECTFRNNVVGIYSRHKPLGGNPYTLHSFAVSTSVFEGTNIGFLPPYDDTYSQNEMATSVAQPQPPFVERPASGILLKEITAVTIGVDNYTSPLTNTFRDMWNGISLNNCGAVITNCEFSGMQVDADHHALSSGYSAQAAIVLSIVTNPDNYGSHYESISSNAISSMGGTLHVYSLNGDDGTTPTFSNCHRGIVNGVGSINTTPASAGDYMFFRDVHTGVRSENLDAVEVADLNTLDIEANAHGIISDGTGGGAGSETNIHNNVIHVVKNTDVEADCWGIECLGDPLVDVDHIVEHNEVTCEGANDGIRLENIAAPTNQTTVQNNIVDMDTPPLGQAATSFYYGIYLNDCDEVLVGCNTVTDNAASQPTTYGIACTASENLDIEGNTTDEFVFGIFMRDFCDNTDIRGNQIFDHVHGLHYYDATTQVGLETDRGNEWLGAYTDGAKFAGGPSSGQIIVNEYRIDPLAVATYLPPSITPSSSWFIPITATNQFDYSDVVCDEGTRSGPQPIETERSDYYLNLLRMAASVNDSSLYGEEMNWYQKNLLYKELCQDSSLMDNYQLLAAAYDSLSNSNIHYLRNIFTAAGNINSGTSIQASNLQQLLTAKDSLWNLWIDAVQQNDSINAGIYAGQLNQVQTGINSLRQDIHTQAISRQSAAIALLGNYNPTNLIEQNMADAFSIYLNHVFDANAATLSGDEAQLAALAYQCPLSGGQGVYIARHLYRYLYPAVSFDDDALCNADQENRQITDTRKEELMSGTLVYPNPSTGFINIVTGKKQLGTIFIKDITGRTALTPVIDHAQNPVIDCSMLQKGIYLMELTYLNHATETFKVNLIK